MEHLASLLSNESSATTVRMFFFRQSFWEDIRNQPGSGGDAMLNQNRTRVQTERHITGIWKTRFKMWPQAATYSEKKERQLSRLNVAKGRWLSSQQMLSSETSESTSCQLDDYNKAEIAHVPLSVALNSEWVIVEI